MISILNIETSSRLCSVSLSSDGKMVSYKESRQPDSHSAMLAVMVNEIVADIDVVPSAVSVSIGPGSYTGLRIGLSLAKGLAFRWSIPLISIPTLKIVAAGYMKCVNPGNSSLILCPMMDAGRNEVYVAQYDTDLNELLKSHPFLIDNPDINIFTEGFEYIVMGSGAEKAEKKIKNKNICFDLQNYLCAEYMPEISYKMYKEEKFSDIAYQTPEYLKEFVAIKPKSSLIYKGTQFD